MIVEYIRYLRTDSASFLSERQRIVPFSAFQSDRASPRLVSAHTASHDPPVTLPPLHLAGRQWDEGYRAVLELVVGQPTDVRTIRSHDVNLTVRLAVVRV